MAGDGADGDTGLASSIWAPLNASRPPYHFKKTTAAQSFRRDDLPPAPRRATSPVQHMSPPPPPPPAIDAAALHRIPTPWAELGRFLKIVRRLRWKLPFLAQGYNAATAAAAAGDAEAELMFKLDFFEYYMLLERTLVHLMGVFGVRVTGGFGGAQGAARNGRQTSGHRFHANVLAALDDPRNPLHGTLGCDEVRCALARAKELRNRWKNADDADAAAPLASTTSTTAAARRLQDYDLERILETIFAGFDQGFRVADRYVGELRQLAAQTGGAGLDMGVHDAAEEESQWEFMTDAMDWEAV